MRWAVVRMDRGISEGCPSGQRDQAVNLARVALRRFESFSLHSAALTAENSAENSAALTAENSAALTAERVRLRLLRSARPRCVPFGLCRGRLPRVGEALGFGRRRLPRVGEALGFGRRCLPRVGEALGFVGRRLPRVGEALGFARGVVFLGSARPLGFAGSGSCCRFLGG